MRNPQTLPPPTVLTYSQASAYLGLPSVAALRMMVYRGKAPPSIRFGMRDRRFRVADIDGWLERNAAVMREPSPAPMEARKPGRPTKVAQARRRAAMT